MNTYIIEIIRRFNLDGVTLPNVALTPVGSGNFFTIYRAEVDEQHLGMVIARLDEAEHNGEIVTYYYQQMFTERE